MRVPISYALHYPERADVDVPTLDLASGRRAHLRAARPRDLRLPAPRPRGRRGGGTAPCVLNAADEVAVDAFLDGRIPFTGDRRGDRARRSRRCPAAPVRHFEDLFEVDEEAREHARGADRGLGGRMSWVLVVLGFAALIILHEVGHFVAAKATGMRVERFFLFFPPKLVSVQARRDRVRDRDDPRSAAS